jgi:arylsulfatase A-like enzyme
MDLLPTIAAMTGSTLPEDRPIDGHDITALLEGGSDARSPTDIFLYYTAHGELAGIREGRWKLLLESGSLHDLEIDIAEQWNRAERHPELVESLRAKALERDRLISEGARPVRTVDTPLWDPAYLPPKGP